MKTILIKCFDLHSTCNEEKLIGEGLTKFQTTHKFKQQIRQIIRHQPQAVFISFMISVYTSLLLIQSVNLSTSKFSENYLECLDAHKTIFKEKRGGGGNH